MIRSIKLVTLIIFFSIFQMHGMINQLLKEANQGHPEALLKMVLSYLEQKDFIKAQEYYYRFLIRARQDIPCCKDKSVASVLDIKMIMPMHFLETGGAESFDRNAEKMMEKAIAWAEQLTKEEKLPSPEWVARYGMNQFLPNGENIFVSQCECNKFRANIIEEYKKAFCKK